VPCIYLKRRNRELVTGFIKVVLNLQGFSG
jgi:hypothetical protein